MSFENFLEKVRGMSLEERFDSLVRCGIVTSDGKLSPEYGGESISSLKLENDERTP